MMKRVMAVLGVMVFFLIHSPAWGDVTVETTFKTGGVKGMGASEGTSLERYKGDKKWESSSLKFTGAILSRLAGGSEAVTITRIDKGVYWNLDPKSRTYQETPIALPELKPEAKENKREEKPTARVTKSDFSVKKTGASESINGYPCEEYLVTWLLEIEDLETRNKSQSLMKTNLWTTPETGVIQKVKEEQQQFNLALAQKMGVKISPGEAKQMGMAAMAAMSRASQAEIEKGLVRVREEMAKIKGYPIRTVISWKVEGDKSPRPAREERAERPTDLSGGLGSLVGGLMGRVAQKKVEEKAAGNPEAPFFSSTLEVKSMAAEAVSPDAFEIPSGYKKK